MKISILIFIYTIQLACQKEYTKFKSIGSNWSWEIFDRKLSLERNTNEKMKGLTTNMRLFLLHNTTHHYQAVYQISES